MAICKTCCTDQETIEDNDQIIPVLVYNGDNTNVQEKAIDVMMTIEKERHSEQVNILIRTILKAIAMFAMLLKKSTR